MSTTNGADTCEETFPVEWQLDWARQDWLHDIDQEQQYERQMIAEALRASLEEATTRLDPVLHLDAGSVWLLLSALPLPSVAQLATCSQTWACTVRDYLACPSTRFTANGSACFYSSQFQRISRSARIVNIGQCCVDGGYEDFATLPTAIERLTIDLRQEHYGLSALSFVPPHNIERIWIIVHESRTGRALSQWAAESKARLARFPRLRCISIDFCKGYRPLGELTWTRKGASSVAHISTKHNIK